VPQKTTNKVLPGTPTLEQTTEELLVRVLVNVQFTPPTGEKLYMVLARPWPRGCTVLYKIDRDLQDVLKLM
jgi:hypothetical protein